MNVIRPLFLASLLLAASPTSYAEELKQTDYVGCGPTSPVSTKVCYATDTPIANVPGQTFRQIHCYMQETTCGRLTREREKRQNAKIAYTIPMTAVNDLVREQLRPCFNPPFGAKENPDLVADIGVTMNPDGTVQQARIVDTGRYASDAIYRAIADTGMRALKNPRCSPLRLPQKLQTFIVGISVRDMR